MQGADRRRRAVVMSILVVGWLAAAAVYVRAAPAEPQDDEIADMQHSKKALRDLERIGGKAAVFTSDLNERVAALVHGRALAYTLALLTPAAAAAYAFLARRYAESAPAEDGERR